MFSVWSEVFFTWVFNSAGMVCSLNSCSAFRIDPKARCQLPVLDLPDLPVSRVLLCLLLPSVPIPAAVLGSLLLLSGVSGCVVGAPQKWRDKPLPAPEPAPAPTRRLSAGCRSGASLPRPSCHRCPIPMTYAGSGRCGAGRTGGLPWVLAGRAGADFLLLSV